MRMIIIEKKLMFKHKDIKKYQVINHKLKLNQ